MGRRNGSWKRDDNGDRRQSETILRIPYALMSEIRPRAGIDSNDR